MLTTPKLRDCTPAIYDTSYVTTKTVADSRWCYFGFAILDENVAHSLLARRYHKDWKRFTQKKISIGINSYSPDFKRQM